MQRLQVVDNIEGMNEAVLKLHRNFINDRKVGEDETSEKRSGYLALALAQSTESIYNIDKTKQLNLIQDKLTEFVEISKKLLDHISDIQKYVSQMDRNFLNTLGFDALFAYNAMAMDLSAIADYKFKQFNNVLPTGHVGENNPYTKVEERFKTLKKQLEKLETEIEKAKKIEASQEKKKLSESPVIAVNSEPSTNTTTLTATTTLTTTTIITKAAPPRPGNPAPTDRPSDMKQPHQQTHSSITNSNSSNGNSRNSSDDDEQPTVVNLGAISLTKIVAGKKSKSDWITIDGNKKNEQGFQNLNELKDAITAALNHLRDTYAEVNANAKDQKLYNTQLEILDNMIIQYNDHRDSLQETIESRKQGSLRVMNATFSPRPMTDYDILDRTTDNLLAQGMQKTGLFADKTGSVIMKSLLILADYEKIQSDFVKNPKPG